MPDLRKDPIIGRWVIVSTERAKRPKDFGVVPEKPKGKGFCPFCPGNESATPPEVLAYRENGEPNSEGWGLRVVPNKFPALKIEGGLDREGLGVYDRMNGVGAHEVIIESPDHNASFATLTQKQANDVIFAYRDRIMDLKKDPRLKYVLIFKNHGEAAGASLEHTHSQLIALPIVPRYVIEEMTGAKDYYSYKERCVYCDIVRQETGDATRIVVEDDNFLAICPYASRFPFEVWILPKVHSSSFEMAPEKTYSSLAKVLLTTMKKLDRALDSPPYNFIIHTSPLKGDAPVYYHWHIEIMPTLTKVAGFEWGSGFYINPTPPEEAAAFLRELEI